MPISQAMSFLSEIISGERIPPGKLAFFQARTRNRLYDFVMNKFAEKEAAGLTRAELARRIGKKPEQISRLLGAPGNWTTDTASDLLLGIAGEELNFSSSSLADRRPVNFSARDSLEEVSAQTQKQETSISRRILNAPHVPVGVDSGTNSASAKIVAPA
jgi:plasmid maintenance system antidote protein VapI